MYDRWQFMILLNTAVGMQDINTARIKRFESDKLYTIYISDPIIISYLILESLNSSRLKSTIFLQK
jgi:hypothetical protein